MDEKSNTQTTSNSDSGQQITTTAAATTTVPETTTTVPQATTSRPQTDELKQVDKPEISVRPKDTFFKGEPPKGVPSESPKGATSQQNILTMAGIHPVQKTTLDNTELILVSCRNIL